MNTMTIQITDNALANKVEDGDTILVGGEKLYITSRQPQYNRHLRTNDYRFKCLIVTAKTKEN